MPLQPDINFDPSRVGGIECDGEYVRCPMCGFEQGDCWEWVKDTPREDDCPGCGGTLSVWAEYDVTYYTEAVSAPASVDRSPEGEKPQALSAKHESAVGAPSAETPNPSLPNSSGGIQQ